MKYYLNVSLLESEDDDTLYKSVDGSLIEAFDIWDPELGWYDMSPLAMMTIGDLESIYGCSVFSDLELLEKFESTEYARAFCEAVVVVTTW